MKKLQKNICFYFQVHQPFRLSKCNAFEIWNKDEHFVGPPNFENYQVFEKVSRKCYLPTNALILELLNQYPEFKVSYSFSGVFLEQCLNYGDLGKEVLDSFKKIVKTGRAEVLSETYHHSLAWLYSKEEFAQQIQDHRKLVYKIFRKKPTVFRNTELIYDNEIGNFIKEMGFKGMLAEGWDHYLGWRSPNHLYVPKEVDLHSEDVKIAEKYKISASSHKLQVSSFKLLLKNYKLSDDIAFRFSNQNWSEWPLTADKYAQWLESTDGETINLFMDYETFGEHQWEDTGIFEFMRHLPQFCRQSKIAFKTPSETLKACESVGEFDVPHLMSWADMERDISAWRSNKLQESALQYVFELEPKIKAILENISKKSGEALLGDWRKMQTSDHFYYMCIKYWNDGDVHAYFSPYESPYDAFINYMNNLRSFESKLEQVA